MRNLKKLLLIIFVLLVLAVVIVFVLENQQPSTLVVFGHALPQLPVSLFILLAFLGGMVVGPILALMASMRRSRARKVRSL